MKIEKSIHMPLLSNIEKSQEQILNLLYEGNDIIFVTEKDMFVGCITVGDIKRMLCNITNKIGENLPFEKLINRNCKRIIYKDERQAEKEAETIFEKYSSIHNIPVVDTEGRLRFQYRRKDEKQKNEIWKKLTVLEDNGSIDNFFKWYGEKKYIIVSADKEISKMTLEFFRERISETEIPAQVCVMDLLDIDLENEDSFVICLSNVAEIYLLLTVGNFQTRIINFNELNRYASCWCKNIDGLLKVEKEDIELWADLFGYQKVCFNTLNRYVLYLKPLMIASGLVVCDREMTNTDIIFMSQEEKYIDIFTPCQLAFILEIISAYRYIMGMSISKEEYMNYFFLLLQKRREKEKLVYLYKKLNILDNEIYWKIVDNNIMESVNIEEIDKNKSNGKFLSEKNLRISVMVTVLENNIIYKLKNYFPNMYIHRLQDNYKLLSYPGRNILNANRKRNEFFSKEFFMGIYGDEYKEAQEIISSNSVEMLQLHTCYSKFQSNYHSKYWCSDTYGNPVVTDAPKEYYGTIYLVGNCLYSGYAANNKYTVASYLQRIVNQNGYMYKVVVLGGLGNMWDKYLKIRERKIQSQDILIILMSQDLFCQIRNENLIYTDWDEIAKKIAGENWYWDKPIHCSYRAYEIIANQIYEKITRDLIIEEKLPSFSLNSRLEEEIKIFLENLQVQLNSFPAYQNIVKKHIGNEIKSGAIVMNCNPFTLGHLYLIETAARIVDILYIFVVEEDKSQISFKERFRMVQEGICHISNVVIVPSGKFMISTITFAGYFRKDTPESDCYDSFLDLKIFAHYIAPTLNISIRFVGEEPVDQVTAQYNKDMKMILGDEGIMVIEIPRKKVGMNPITATRVRSLLKTRDWEMISELVPESTLLILKSMRE